jgi:hypothetical protein
MVWVGRTQFRDKVRTNRDAVEWYHPLGGERNTEDWKAKSVYILRLSFEYQRLINYLSVCIYAIYLQKNELCILNKCPNAQYIILAGLRGSLNWLVISSFEIYIL